MDFRVSCRSSEKRRKWSPRTLFFGSQKCANEVRERPKGPSSIRRFFDVFWEAFLANFVDFGPQHWVQNKNNFHRFGSFLDTYLYFLVVGCILVDFYRFWTPRERKNGENSTKAVQNLTPHTSKLEQTEPLSKPPVPHHQCLTTSASPPVPSHQCLTNPPHQFSKSTNWPNQMPHQLSK